MLFGLEEEMEPITLKVILEASHLNVKIALRALSKGKIEPEVWRLLWFDLIEPIISPQDYEDIR